MLWKKIAVPASTVLESPSVPPPAVAGWVQQAETGLPEALAALANPAAAVDPCPPGLLGIGWLPLVDEPGEGEG